MFIFIIGSILVFIAFIIAIVVFLIDDDNGKACFSVFFITLLGATLVFIGMIENDKSKYPQAIDVYRGNTTLQITYKDSIPVDTVVIFKNK